MSGAGPEWFRAALSVPCETPALTVEGVDIELRAWGTRGRPGVLFVHGMLAHARWWDFIAPQLAGRYRCAALSLSGMGRSGWRPAYSIAGYVAELQAAIVAAGLDTAGPPVVVAHSFGSYPARRLAEWRGASLSGLVMLDAPVRLRPRTAPAEPPRPYVAKRYDSVRDAVDSFRLVPAQACANPFLLEHVATTGLRRVDDAWVRGFDPSIRLKLAATHDAAGLGTPGCPVAFIWGEDSKLVDDAVRAHLSRWFPDAPRIGIPGAAHHVMLDQPLHLVRTLDTLLSAWPPGQ